MPLKLSEDIRPVTDLKSHGAEIVRDVTSGRTVVLIRHGRAEREIAAGQGLPHANVRERLLALTRTP